MSPGQGHPPQTLTTADPDSSPLEEEVRARRRLEAAALGAIEAQERLEGELRRLRATRGWRAVELVWSWRERGRRALRLVRGPVGSDPSERVRRAWELVKQQGPRSFLGVLWESVAGPSRRGGLGPHPPADGPPPETLLVGPLVSLIAQEEGWRQALGSLQRQSYSHWELLVVSPQSASAELLLAAQREPRLRLLLAPPLEAPRRGLAEAGGEWLALLPPGRLAVHALAWVVWAAREDPRRDLLYSDEDVWAGGERCEPRFKPDWSPDLLLSTPYTGDLTVWRRSVAIRVGGFRAEFASAQGYDLTLRVSEQAGAIHRVPRILFHRSGQPEEFHAAEWEAAGLRVLEDTLSRRGERGWIQLQRLGQQVGFRVRRELSHHPSVGVLVPTRDRPALLQACLESVQGRSTYPNLQLVVIDNGSQEPRALAYLEQLEREGVQVLRAPGPFNFSALMNRAARVCEAEVLLFLNNDTEVLAPDWLECLVEHALRPEVGAVGAKLLFPDGTVQHAGVVLGLGSGAGHGHLGLAAHDPGYLGRASLIGNYAAVTGACLAVRREAFWSVGGFDEEALPINYGDVDLCLRLAERGLRTVFTPYALLTHHESASRSKAPNPREAGVLRRRWTSWVLNDPYYSPHLTRFRPDFSWDTPLPGA